MSTGGPGQDEGGDAVQSILPGLTVEGGAAPDPAAVTDLHELARALRSCTACPELAATRTQVVAELPAPGARLVVMGEAPGATEDETGTPFVGRSGQLLDALLAEVGLARADVAVLNTVKCRPPGNRPPTRRESATCRPWTERQLALLAPPAPAARGAVVAPLVVVALGLSATRWWLGPTSLSAARGRVHELPAARVVATYHPSAALRFGPSGEPRRLLREDLATAAALT